MCFQIFYFSVDAHFIFLDGRAYFSAVKYRHNASCNFMANTRTHQDEGGRVTTVGSWGCYHGLRETQATTNHQVKNSNKQTFNLSSCSSNQTSFHPKLRYYQMQNTIKLKLMQISLNYYKDTNIFKLFNFQIVFVTDLLA